MQTQSAFSNFQHHRSGFLLAQDCVRCLSKKNPHPIQLPNVCTNLHSRLWCLIRTGPQQDHNAGSLLDDRLTHRERAHLWGTPSGSRREAAWDRHRCTRDRQGWRTLWPAIWSHNVVSVKHRESYCEWVCEWASERASEWVSEWKNGWINEWMNKYLFPDNHQHNEWDDYNDQQHQNSSGHSKLRMWTWTHHEQHWGGGGWKMNDMIQHDMICVKSSIIKVSTNKPFPYSMYFTFTSQPMSIYIMRSH